MRQGGSYKVDDKGTPQLVERTNHHPKGDRARDEKGQPLAARRPAPPSGGKVSRKNDQAAPAKAPAKATSKDGAQ